MRKPDFSGWATKYNVLCTDGRVISPGSFAHQDGVQVPLVWNHNHSDPTNILGYAILKHMDEGVYADAYFNDTEKAQTTKRLLLHGDINQLSIFANQLKQAGNRVMHGMIKELSTVIGGANPEAFINNLSIAHNDGESEFEAEIYTNQDDLFVVHNFESEETIYNYPENLEDEIIHSDAINVETFEDFVLEHLIEVMNPDVKHYGVPGMKWGVIRNKVSSMAKNIKSRYDGLHGIPKTLSNSDINGLTKMGQYGPHADEIFKEMTAITTPIWNKTFDDIKSGKITTKEEENRRKKETWDAWDAEWPNVKKRLGIEDLPDDDLKHSDIKDGETTLNEPETPEELKHADEGGIKMDPDIQEEVLNSMNEEQKELLYTMVGNAMSQSMEKILEDSVLEHADTQTGGNTMKENAFAANPENQESALAATTLTHAAFQAIVTDAKDNGASLKTMAKKHGFTEISINDLSQGQVNSLAHGITDMDYLFPDAKNLTKTPLLIKRRTEWVDVVMNTVGRTPFSRVKCLYADITEDDARAKGYIKGDEKISETIVLLRRIVEPTTVYSKQEFERDDVVDIVDFDVIVWIKGIMRMQLDEEIGRAVLIGDGRDAASRQKVNPSNIKPIWTDDDLYTIKRQLVYGASATDDEKARLFIKTAIKARKEYKGAGNPTLFTTEDVLTDCLLIEDLNQRVIYDTMEKLSTALRVSKIVTVTPMETATRTEGSGETAKTYKPLGLIVNMADYNIGADKGGSVTMFDDFDIDFNKQKFLIETRISGALVVPYSAIALETEVVSVAG